MNSGVAHVMSVITERIALFPDHFWNLHQAGSIFIPLPAYLLFLYLPLFSGLREWANFVLMANVAAAALAAVALMSLRGRRRTFILAMVAVIALAELMPAPSVYGYTEMFSQPVVTWLQQHPDGGAVARFPIRKWTNGSDLYDGYMSGHPITDGYVPFQPPGWREAFPVLDRFPSQETMDMLRRWQVRYVIVSPAAYAAAWPQVEQQIAALPGLRLLATSTLSISLPRGAPHSCGTGIGQ